MKLSSIALFATTLAASVSTGCAVDSGEANGHPDQDRPTGQVDQTLTVARFDSRFVRCPIPGRDGFVVWMRNDYGAYTNAEIAQVAQASPSLCPGVAGVRVKATTVSPGSPLGTGMYWRVVTVTLNVPEVVR